MLPHLRYPLADLITIPMGGQPRTMKVQSYLYHFAMLQVGFHATTAYDILRQVGVNIGKRDYLGSMPSNWSDAVIISLASRLTLMRVPGLRRGTRAGPDSTVRRRILGWRQQPVHPTLTGSPASSSRVRRYRCDLLPRSSHGHATSTGCTRFECYQG
jgi:hypothetical protein